METELLVGEVKYKLVCKKTGKEFFDVSNSSGSITTHLIEFYPEIEQPSAYIKRQYRIKNNKYWHEQFFESVEKEFKTCKYCDWKTVDIDNKSGQYTLHLSKNHGKSINDYLTEFPSESVLFSTYVSNRERFELISNDESQRVTCLVCGKIFKKISNTHLMTHGLSETEYKIKYGGVIFSESLIDRQREIYEDTLRSHESNFVSRGQQEIFDFLESIGVNAKMGDKKMLHGVELDILK